MIYRIYRVSCTLNNKSYIGFTKKPIAKRMTEHLYAAMKRHSHYRLHSAIRKYGPDAFMIEQLAVSQHLHHTLDVLEPMYIVLYNSITNGYNTLSGGSVRTHYEHTKEARFKMSRNNVWRGQDRSGDKNPMFGRTHTAASKAAMSQRLQGTQSRLGMTHTEATKDKISTKAKQRFANGFVSPWKGKSLPAEMIARISASKIGKVSYSKTYSITRPDGTHETIANMADYCRLHGLNRGNMSSVAKGTLPHHKGYKCSIVAT